MLHRDRKVKGERPIVGITLGDPAGIGPEVIAKSLADPKLRQQAQFVLIGDRYVFQRYSTLKCFDSFLDLQALTPKKFTPGRPSCDSAQASMAYLNKAVELLKKGEISSLVTGPVSKEEIAKLGIPFYGHTEFLAENFHVKFYDMMFVGEKIRTLIMTRHIPLKDVSGHLSTEKIFKTICLSAGALKNFFKIKRPHLAVCGLNPHAGEHGLIGQEEQEMIIPAIAKARKKRIHVEGPFPADTIFSPHTAKAYDLIIAMYHDQGLIPIKTVDFEKLVNLTIGLPFVRTSPAHGTAFDIAGKNRANPSSMKAAIELAAHLTRHSSKF